MHQFCLNKHKPRKHAKTAYVSLQVVLTAVNHSPKRSREAVLTSAIATAIIQDGQFLPPAVSHN